MRGRGVLPSSGENSVFSEGKAWIFSRENQQQIVACCVVLGTHVVLSTRDVLDTVFGAGIVVILVIGDGAVVVASYFHFFEQSSAESTKYLRRSIRIQVTLVT